MPEMSGWELIAQVRHLAPEFPVLICSCAVAPGGSGFLSGGIRCVSKPCEPETFTALVREMWRAAVLPAAVDSD